MTAELVLPFSALDRTHLPVAGGKAANLGELTRAGFPVPPGFCVTTAAYAQVAAGSALGPVLAELSRTPAGEIERLSALAARAREALLAAPVPAAVEAACREAYRALGSDIPVAVRSSATAEDLPDASFAGQQDTYLNMVGEAAVLDAIRRCWASLFTERAVAYRAKHEIDPRAVQLAVAVQRLVPAQVAGVLFTADPVTGHRGRAVIDASSGLGEAVVSGAVNPDHFVARKDTGEIIEQRPGDKRVAIEPLAGGGTRRVEKDGASEPCITAAEVAALVRLGAAVEAHYGAPQDTEWALDADRTPCLLQARPITTLFPLPPRKDDELHVYFSFNVAQGVLRPLTPMGLQAWRMFTTGVATFLGFPPAEKLRGVSILAEAAGRLFLDISRLLRSDLGRRFATFALSKMEARSGALVKSLLEDTRLPVQRTPRGWLLRHVLPAMWRSRAPLTLARTALNPEGASAHVEAAWRDALALAEVPAGAGPREKLAVVERIFLQGVRLVIRVMPTVVAGFICITLTRRLLRGLATDEEVNTTLRALPDNPTTEMDLELWHLAVRVRRDAESAAALASTSSAELARRYHEGTLPPVLQRELSAFLERYGARGVAEIDVGVARWAEDPTHILGSLANYLALPEDAHAPDAQFRRGTAEAETMVEELVRRASAAGWLRGKLVRASLRRLRMLTGRREMPKFCLVQLLYRARRLLLELGEELVQAGRLDAADGVFFLDFAELTQALDGLDVRERARERRAAYAREVERRHVPRILLSDGTEPQPPSSGVHAQLFGTPASAGTIAAKARVVMNPVGARIEPGEILVAPSTDPGWTPLFLTAGGLVMEMGGSMSHGAVVAREYGIPAVVGVASATERISTGQLITVDGAAGTVRL